MTRLHVPIPVRWSDLDAYGHVNNARMLGLLEEARIAAFWSTGDAEGPSTGVLDAQPGSSTVTLIGRLEIEYLAPIPHLRQPVDVQLWIGYLGGASFDVCYEVCSPVGVEPATTFARATTTIVLVDAATERPRRLTDHERLAFEPYLDAAIEHRRR